ncbi:hypothetical protein IFR05_001424 [Cadophora sp. M221]|nr:hypothetical protein IFR05_001424 [Cadophora sp. M221]
MSYSTDFQSSSEEPDEQDDIRVTKNHVFYIIQEPRKPRSVKRSRKSEKQAEYNGYNVPRTSSDQWPSTESRPPPNQYQDYQQYTYGNEPTEYNECNFSRTSSDQWPAAESRSPPNPYQGYQQYTYGYEPAEGSKPGATTQYNGFPSGIYPATTTGPAAVQCQTGNTRVAVHNNAQSQFGGWDDTENQSMTENRYVAKNQYTAKDSNSVEDSGSGPSASTPPPQSDVNDSLLHIQVADHKNILRNTIALLDTGCLHGNWISTRKVRELKMGQKIEKDSPAPVMLAVNGEKVPSLGSITLDWKVTNVGTRIFTTSFFLVKADHLDVIFGAQFLFSEGVIQIAINKNAFAPFVKHSEPSQEEKIRIELALEKQRKEILEREKRRELKEEARRQANNRYHTSSNGTGSGDD